MFLAGFLLHLAVSLQFETTVGLHTTYQNGSRGISDQFSREAYSLALAESYVCEVPVAREQKDVQKLSLRS